MIRWEFRLLWNFEKFLFSVVAISRLVLLNGYMGMNCCFNSKHLLFISLCYDHCTTDVCISSCYIGFIQNSSETVLFVTRFLFQLQVQFHFTEAVSVNTWRSMLYHHHNYNHTCKIKSAYKLYLHAFQSSRVSQRTKTKL